MSKREEKKIQALKEAMDNAINVSDDLHLKTAIKQKSLVIISTDVNLYEKLLKKFPKEKVAMKTKGVGKTLTILGVLISVMSFGAFAFIGVPMAGAGVVLGAAGLVLEDYKDYSLFLDYDNMRVIFIKTEGSPSLDLPKNFKL